MSRSFGTVYMTAAVWLDGHAGEDAPDIRADFQWASGDPLSTIYIGFGQGVAVHANDPQRMRDLAAECIRAAEIAERAIATRVQREG